MMSKLAEMKKLADESKIKLGNMTVLGESGGGLVEITMNGNREIKSIKINTELQHMEVDHLEDLLCVAMNRALERVNELNGQVALTSASDLFHEMQ